MCINVSIRVQFVSNKYDIDSSYIQGFQAGSMRQRFSILAPSVTSNVTLEVPSSMSARSRTRNCFNGRITYIIITGIKIISKRLHEIH